MRVYEGEVNWRSIFKIAAARGPGNAVHSRGTSRARERISITHLTLRMPKLLILSGHPARTAKRPDRFARVSYI